MNVYVPRMIAKYFFGFLLNLKKEVWPLEGIVRYNLVGQRPYHACVLSELMCDIKWGKGFFCLLHIANASNAACPCNLVLYCNLSLLHCLSPGGGECVAHVSLYFVHYFAYLHIFAQFCT